LLPSHQEDLFTSQILLTRTNSPHLNRSTYEASSSSSDSDSDNNNNNNNGNNKVKFKLKRNPAWSAILGKVIEPIYEIDWIDTR
jgi:hypothetical protein